MATSVSTTIIPHTKDFVGERRTIVPALHQCFALVMLIASIPLSLVRGGAPATFLDAIAEPAETVPITHAIDCVVEACPKHNHSNNRMPLRRRRFCYARTTTTT